MIVNSTLVSFLSLSLISHVNLEVSLLLIFFCLLNSFVSLLLCEQILLWAHFISFHQPEVFLLNPLHPKEFIKQSETLPTGVLFCFFLTINLYGLTSDQIIN